MTEISSLKKFFMYHLDNKGNPPYAGGKKSSFVPIGEGTDDFVDDRPAKPKNPIDEGELDY